MSEKKARGTDGPGRPAQENENETEQAEATGADRDAQANLSVPIAAFRLGTTAGALYRMNQRGELRMVRVGLCLHVPLEEVERLERERKAG